MHRSRCSTPSALSRRPSWLGPSEDRHARPSWRRSFGRSAGARSSCGASTAGHPSGPPPSTSSSRGSRRSGQRRSGGSSRRGPSRRKGSETELAEKLERLERRREQLGGVNPFAKEEYAAEKARLAELRAQREDLERSLEELGKLRDELTETVDRRFAETFDSVQRNFAEVASTLFPGGHGRLRLTEPG